MEPPETNSWRRATAHGWWTWEDLNLRPLPYQGNHGTSLSRSFPSNLAPDLRLCVCSGWPALVGFGCPADFLRTFCGLAGCRSSPPRIRWESSSLGGAPEINSKSCRLALPVTTSPMTGYSFRCLLR